MADIPLESSALLPELPNPIHASNFHQHRLSQQAFYRSFCLFSSHLMMKETWKSTALLEKIPQNTSLPQIPIYYLNYLLFLLQSREQQWSLRLIGPVSFFLLTSVSLAKTLLSKAMWTQNLASPCLSYLPAPTSPWHCTDFPSDNVNICNQVGWIQRGAATSLHDLQLPLHMSPSKRETWIKGLVSLVLFCNVWCVRGMGGSWSWENKW